MNILGLYPQGPNTASCLLVDGKCVAFAEEERFTRQKLAADTVPVRSSAYCLKHAGLDLDGVESITVGWDNEAYRTRMPAFFRQEMVHPDKDEYSGLYETLSLASKHPVYFTKRLQISYARSGIGGAFPAVHYLPHHQSHAYAVFYPSPFERAIIMVIDGSGEDLATSFWLGEGEKISLLKQVRIPDSLGFFYAAFTEYLGFSAYTGEGKVMGLAPYGGPDLDLRARLDKVLWAEGAEYRVELSYLYYGPRTLSFRYTDRLAKLFGRPPRRPEGGFEQWHKNLAWEVQNKLEQVAEQLLREVIKSTGIRDVCLTGGVAMNCKMNGHLSGLDVVDRCFVLPASNDSGCAYGSALLRSYSLGVKDLRAKAAGLSPYLGPEFSTQQILAAAAFSKISPTRVFENSAELCAYTAEKLAAGAMVGWFQGRMEVGARALGNRSILANPAFPFMKDKLNAEVKKREEFRPFAPSILVEHAGEIFDNTGAEGFEPYHSCMLKAVSARPEVVARMPAVVHVDNTIRPQVVSHLSNALYHELISAFRDRTGLPAVLNTSFNVRGEPIVCSPEEALRCFFSNGLDVCVIGGCVFEKSQG